ncbi:MAG TPA: hypothetical protein PKW33_00865 [Anaerolineaceae bacterium]|nr:hypothetical protein [Anaerolineaceae bacterium]HPN50107.1 hypothetical protein [Anaerolineaceae bacterium]
MQAQPIRTLPEINRLSIIVATILLVYASSRFVFLPSQGLNLSIAGISLPLQADFVTLAAWVSAVLAALGTDWILSDHPALNRDQPYWQRTLPHLILPTLTAWVISLPLHQIQVGWQWWSVLGMGGGLLMLVLMSEYSVVDAEDIRYPAAIVGLTAISFALFLFLAVSVHSVGLRLYLTLPTLELAVGLISLRTLYLRLGGQWRFTWTGVIMLIMAQIITALHYWPLSPARYGLFILAPAYAFTSLGAAIEEEQLSYRIFIEPVIMVALILLLAFWLT